MSKINLFVFGPAALLVCALYSTCPPKPPEQCRAFLQLPPQQRRAEFRAYSLHQQLDVYLCAMKTEPPNSSLAYDIADKGEQAIPALLNKLKAAKSEVDQDNLIYVLEVMSDRKYLRGRKDVIVEISNVIDSMKISQIKERSLERLKKIQINSGIKPFTYAQ